jgi:D-glycero-beta-D-manno-heptose 1-phosphate adenylyltransferase
MIKVFVNGTFDLIHPGHIRLLNYAAINGDYLLVAIDSDSRVKELKGEDRPVNDEMTRQFIMESLKPVNKCLIFGSEEELENIIKEYKPDVMIVGSDYKNERVIGSEYAKELKFFDRLREYSSTNIIERIKR